MYTSHACSMYLSSGHVMKQYTLPGTDKNKLGFTGAALPRVVRRGQGFEFCIVEAPWSILRVLVWTSDCWRRRSTCRLLFWCLYVRWDFRSSPRSQRLYRPQCASMFLCSIFSALSLCLVSLAWTKASHRSNGRCPHRVERILLVVDQFCKTSLGSFYFLLPFN